MLTVWYSMKLPYAISEIFSISLVSSQFFIENLIYNVMCVIFTKFSENIDKM